MNELSALIDKVERPTIYVALVVFAVLQPLALVSEKIDSLLTHRGTAFFLSLLVLLVFRYVAVRLDAPTDRRIVATEDFTRDLLSLLNRVGECDCFPSAEVGHIRGLI